MDERYDPTWALRCDGGNSEKRRQTFARLARRAVVALGLEFRNPLEALDAWLNRVHRFHWGLKTRFGRDHWNIGHVAEASAEYCAELSTRFHEAGNSDSEGKFSDLERQFSELEDPDAEFVAIRRRDTYLERDDYPFTSWLHDHAHEALPDPKMELEYWSDHIWGGYRGRIEHWGHLDRTGPAWAALPEKLKDVGTGLSYDLAVLQANNAIDRGLRGEDAVKDFQAEADKLLAQVIDAVRAGWRHLGFSFDDSDGDRRMLAEPFDRVRGDLRKATPKPPAARLLPTCNSTGSGFRPDGFARSRVPSRKRLEIYRSGLDNLDSLLSKLEEDERLSLPLKKQIETLFSEMADARILTAKCELDEFANRVRLQIHAVRPTVEAMIENRPAPLKRIGLWGSLARLSRESRGAHRLDLVAERAARRQAVVRPIL